MMKAVESTGGLLQASADASHRKENDVTRRLLTLLLVLLAAVLPACSAATPAATPAPPAQALRIIADSENKTLEPISQEYARKERLTVEMTYKGVTPQPSCRSSGCRARRCRRRSRSPAPA
jgi:hypothetical protein